jgi:hypothetical protein
LTWGLQSSRGKGSGSPHTDPSSFAKNQAGKGVIEVSDPNTIFILSREDVVDCAREMGIPEEAITDDILAQVKKGVEWGLECWSEVMKEAINMALKS